MKGFLEFIKSFFGGVWHFLLDYVHVAIPEAKAVLLKDLLPIADKIVKDLNDKDMTPIEKRDAAFGAIAVKAAAIGIDVATHLIYLAIEMAVTKLRSLQEAVKPVEGNGGVLAGGVQEGG